MSSRCSIALAYQAGFTKNGQQMYGRARLEGFTFYPFMNTL